MFDFLRSKDRKPQPELVTSIIIPQDNRYQSPKSPKKLSPKKPIKDSPEHAENNSQNFDHQRYLIDQLKKSQKIVGFNERQGIQDQRMGSQMKIHDIETGKPQGQILNKMFKRKVQMNNPGRAQVNMPSSQQIEELISASNRKVEQAQQKGLLNRQQNHSKNRSLVPKSKDDLKELQKVDKYRLLKIKNGEIRNKVGNLREQLQQQYYRKKASYKLPQHQNVKNSDYYSIENPRTKQANKFIKQLNQKRRMEIQKLAQYKMRKRQEQEMKRSMIEDEREMEKLEKKRRLEELYHEKQIKKRMEQQENLKKKSQIAQWSKIFQKEKPLHIRKQQQYFENHVIPQLYEREQALILRKLQRKPIDMEQIQNHDERYMQFKRDDEIRKQAQLQLAKQRQRQLQEEQRQYYKGKYRYMALDEIMAIKNKLNQDPAETDRIKKARQIVYGDYVKEMEAEKAKNKPYGTRESQKKKFNKRVRNLNGSVSVESSTEPNMSHRSDPRHDGKKNLHYMHELVREKGIKKDHPQIKLVEQKGVYTDYMAEARQKRRRSLNLSRISKPDSQYDTTQATPNIDSLKAQTQSLDLKVQRGAMRKKHQKISLEEDQQIEAEQIKAIKMKMKLLNTID